MSLSLVRLLIVSLVGVVLRVQAASNLSIRDHIANPNATASIPQHFIAVYHDHVPDDAVELHRRSIETTLQKRSLSTPDFTPSITPIRIGDWRALDLRVEHDMIPDIAQAAEIKYVEQGVVKRASQTPQTIQPDAPIGLARISHRDMGHDNYHYDPSPGSGITVYVVDSGIYIQHEEFEGRAIWGTNKIDGTDSDVFGHGSHVAGTIGGKTYGVAKKATLVAVKILAADGHGTTNSFVQGIEWVVNDAKGKNSIGTVVINLSIEGEFSQAENDAVASAVSAGVVAVVAAGNYYGDASQYSPASAQGAICVGAIDPTTDSKPSWSNSGTIVDIYAPGVNITSVGITSTQATAVKDGTSMACPHVAGLTAYLMKKHGLTKPSDVLSKVTTLAGMTRSKQTSTVSLIAWNGACVYGTCCDPSCL